MTASIIDSKYHQYLCTSTCPRKIPWYQFLVLVFPAWQVAKLAAAAVAAPDSSTNKVGWTATGTSITLVCGACRLANGHHLHRRNAQRSSYRRAVR